MTKRSLFPLNMHRLSWASVRQQRLCVSQHCRPRVGPRITLAGLLTVGLMLHCACPGISLGGEHDLIVTDRAVVQRCVTEGGSRSIAVGMPGGFSYCFDPVRCRLAFVRVDGTAFHIHVVRLMDFFRHSENVILFRTAKRR